MQWQGLLWKITLQSSAPNPLSHKNESEFSTLPLRKLQVASADEPLVSEEESTEGKESVQHIKSWGTFVTKEDQSAT